MDRNASQPQITTAPDGTATAVWRLYNGSNEIIQAATRPPGGSFGTPVDLSATDQNGTGPQVTTAPDGSATSVWQSFKVSEYVIQAISTAQPTFTLDAALTGPGGGRVASAPSGIDCGSDCSESYLSYTPVTLTATPDSGSTFEGWGGDCEGAAGNTCELTMLEDQNVTAGFTAPPNPPSAGKPKLKINKFKPKKPKVKRGKKVKIKVTGKNVGDKAAKNAKLCLRIKKGVKKKLKPKGKRCKKLGRLAPGQAKKKKFKLKATRKAKKGRYKVKVKLSAANAETVKRAVKLKVR
jgi:hypothetical protein